MGRSCFHLSKGALGNKNGSRVLDLIGLMEAASLVWSDLAKGFCTGALGRTVNFQVVASGSQQHITRLSILIAANLHKVSHALIV